MALLTKEQILKADDNKSEIVSVPGWGGDVKVTTMSSRARDEYEASFLDRSGKQKKNYLENVRARLVASTVVDDTGKRIFSMEDVKLLGEKNGECMDLVFAAAQKLNGISDKDIEEIAKNS